MVYLHEAMETEVRDRLRMGYSETGILLLRILNSAA